MTDTPDDEASDDEASDDEGSDDEGSEDAAPDDESDPAPKDVKCSLHPRAVGEYQCRACKRMLCQVCAKGSKKGVCRRCVQRREKASKKVPGFCRECHDETTQCTPVKGVLVNGTGFQHMNMRSLCEKCNSFETTLWFCIFLCPLFPVGAYRSIQLTEEGWITHAQHAMRKAPLTKEGLFPTIFFLPLALGVIGFIIWFNVGRK